MCCLPSGRPAPGRAGADTTHPAPVRGDSLSVRGAGMHCGGAAGRPADPLGAGCGTGTERGPSLTGPDRTGGLRRKCPERSGECRRCFLRAGGCTQLDALILTHCHDDHANGVPELLERMEVGLLVLPDLEEDAPLRQEILDLAKEQGTEVPHAGREHGADPGRGPPAALSPSWGWEEAMKRAFPCCVRQGPLTPSSPGI